MELVVDGSARLLLIKTSLTIGRFEFQRPESS